MRRALTLLLLAGCPHGSTPSSQPDLTVAQVVDRLAKARAELTAFRADSTMDYWLGSQRLKGEVLVMGTTGAKVRFAALSPAGGSTMVEMACDGTNYTLVDHQNNCARSGACDQQSIAQFFHIELAPDDFVHLALGTPPVIASPTGTITWDSNKGVHRVALTGGEGTEKLAIDTTQGRFDVVDCELVGPDGKTRWSVANTDFTEVGGHRVPGKTRFRSPTRQEDLLVDWGSSFEVNPALDASKFALTAPAGLPLCPGPGGTSGSPQGGPNGSPQGGRNPSP
jgi:hypothetical protein